MSNNEIELKDGRILITVQYRSFDATPKRIAYLINTVGVLSTILVLRIVSALTSTPYLNNYVLLIGFIGTLVHLFMLIYRGRIVKGFDGFLLEGFSLTKNPRTKSINIFSEQGTCRIFKSYSLRRLVSLERNQAVYQIAGKPSTEFIKQYIQTYVPESVFTKKSLSVKIAYILDIDNRTAIKYADSVFSFPNLQEEIVSMKG